MRSFSGICFAKARGGVSRMTNASGRVVFEIEDGCCDLLDLVGVVC